MSQHNAFVMNTTVQLSDVPRLVVMCSNCGHKRPRMIADCGEMYLEAVEMRDIHNASNLVTDVMGKPV